MGIRAGDIAILGAAGTESKRGSAEEFKRVERRAALKRNATPTDVAAAEGVMIEEKYAFTCEAIAWTRIKHVAYWLSGMKKMAQLICRPSFYLV